jgi:hypothetical protein
VTLLTWVRYGGAGGAEKKEIIWNNATDTAQLYRRDLELKLLNVCGYSVTMGLQFPNQRNKQTNKQRKK